ncbi:hypothetical protein HG531_011531 [Fusarium graminearum]|nr:hypothetical protein HG531_011531 [Fusarium graminearum]
MDKLCSLGNSIFDMLSSFGHCTAVDKRTVGRLLAETVSNNKGLDNVEDHLDELVVNAAMHKDTVGANTGLT